MTVRAYAENEGAVAENSPVKPASEARLNLFRDQALSRRNAPRNVPTIAGSTNYDQKPWSLLYKAIVDSIGASPENFQLLYPFASWNWPTQSVGFISSNQYDFCSTIPQWSAVGSYNSSGDRFNQAYEQFLNIIVAQTDDPVLRDKIRVLNEVLTDASNEYTTAYQQADSVYQDSPGGSTNTPSFTDWLASGAGRGWQTKIVAAQTRMEQAQKNYNAVVSQANTPGLENALKQFKNAEFYSKLNNPGLSSFPKVPMWDVSQNPSAWVDAIKAGQGPAGAQMGFANRDSAYDYSHTWAGGSLSVGSFFWQVNLSGKWERITEFETDQELIVSVTFEAIDHIQIQPSDWYNGSFVRSMATGPFMRGYSPDGDDGDKAVFGEKGFIGLVKTGMAVGYKPTFTITTSQSTFQKFVEKFKAALGIRIGPFTIDAAGGSEKSQWSYSEAGRSFTGTSTSESPLILGVTIARLPQQNKPALALADGDATAEALGDAYRFEEGAGDLLASLVTETQAQALGAQSWIPRRSLEQAALVTRHAHDVRIVPLYGDPVLTDGIASIDFNGAQLTELRAGIFAINRPIPKVGTEYSVSGWYDDSNLPFNTVLTCVSAGRPMSKFRKL